MASRRNRECSGVAESPDVCKCLGNVLVAAPEGSCSCYMILNAAAAEMSSAIGGQLSTEQPVVGCLFGEEAEPPDASARSRVGGCIEAMHLKQQRTRGAGGAAAERTARATSKPAFDESCVRTLPRNHWLRGPDTNGRRGGDR